MRSSMVFLLWMALLPSVVQAETAYITDRLFVSIREGQGNEFPVVKSIATGTALEVLQRLGGFALVREPGGAEGWIAERYLVNTSPGKAELDGTRNRLKLANNELSTLKQRLAASRKQAREEKARANALEKKLGEMGASPEKSTEPPEGVTETSHETGQREPVKAGFYFNWLWFLIAFAMLVTGFVAGVVWLRELNRKKMGGMYLRI